MSAELRDQLQATLGRGYTLERELGGGGMSRVFVANDTTLGRRVVVKVLPSELAASVSVSRFQREIQLAAQLQHPHIVPVLSAGVSEGLPYYTMPFVEGESLRVRLSRTGELPVHEAVGILRDVVKALAYAHRHGVVHRDIKPENVLLTEDAALVADFGVAKALSASTQGDGVVGGDLTSLGVALGTPAYMSPEQASADPHVDHRADIYAVGIMAYELLVGYTPFAGRNPQAMLAAQLNEVPVPIDQRRPMIPGSLASLVSRCLEKRPADRPQSAGELLQVFDALVTPSGGATPTGMTPASTSAQLSARTIGAIAVAAVVILATGVLLAQRSARPQLVRERVLIAPFVDKTGDPLLASLSAMTVDWITRSLRESRVADVAAMPQTTAASGAGDLTVERIRALARATGAATIIGGTVYRMGDSIQLTANVADARREEVVQSIAIAALATSPMSAIDGLRSRIVGVLAARLDTSITDIAESTSQPPSYEAYREYLTGDDAFRRGDYQTALRGFLAAASLDSTFTFPLVRAAYAYANLASRESLEYDSLDASKIDSINRTLAARRNRMSAFDVAYLDRVLGWVHGDLNASYEAGKRMATIAPRSDFARYVAARSAIPVNQLHAAAAAFEAMERDGSLTTSREVNFYNDLASVYHRLGEYDKELETARRGIAKFPQRNRPIFNELQALAALGRTEEALRKAEALLGRPRDAQDEPADLTAIVSAELLWHGYPSAAKTLAQRTLATWNSMNTRDSLASDRGLRVMLIPALVAGDLNEADRLLDMARDKDALRVIVSRGILAAKRGDTATADAVLTRLERKRGPYLRSAHIIGQARIAAALGRRDRAVELLRQALASGASFDNTVHQMPEFAPYANHPPLLALFKSKD